MRIFTIVFYLAIALLPAWASGQDLPKPNILWITSEDNSPFMGCYGDTFATTPNLDQLAARGFRYTHAYANAPVCAPTRNTIITGVYANSAGQENMRSFYRKSDVVKLYPEYLRAAGYYCTNNQKEDFNIAAQQTTKVWDQIGKNAHYQNRPAGQPFFAIFNSTITHESSIHTTTPDEALRHRPDKVKLPPYHPDTPEMRHDWAQYYDKIEDMDTWVGEILKDLAASGEAENTIIFYYGDHGGVLGRSKRYVYESGTRVPFLVHIPEKYRHLYPATAPGDSVSRIVSFVDLVPTLLSLTGIEIPDYLQGHAFLGSKKTSDPEYAFMFRGRMDERYDLSRAVRDRKFRYIRNYMPYRPYGQPIEYLFRAPSLRSWEQACLSGNCDEIQKKFWESKPPEELYDTENDPWEIHNLAENPQYRSVLERMRQANRDWILSIHDAGFIPEAILADQDGQSPIYDYMRSGKVHLENQLAAAEYASTANADLQELIRLMASADPTVRYWGVTGLLIAGERARPFLKALEKATTDRAASVAVVAAEALYLLGSTEAARKTLMQIVGTGSVFARTHALNVLDYAGEDSPKVQKAVVDMVKSNGDSRPDRYDLRMARFLFDKWGVDPEKVGISIKW